jgi:hypothetical protein
MLEGFCRLEVDSAEEAIQLNFVRFMQEFETLNRCITGMNFPIETNIYGTLCSRQ